MLRAIRCAWGEVVGGCRGWAALGLGSSCVRERRAHEKPCTSSRIPTPLIRFLGKMSISHASAWNKRVLEDEHLLRAKAAP
jgi:hypothetical protein